MYSGPQKLDSQNVVTALDPSEAEAKKIIIIKTPSRAQDSILKPKDCVRKIKWEKKLRVF